MEKSTQSSGTDRLLIDKERYFSFIEKTLSVITDSVKTRRSSISDISAKTSLLEQNRQKTLRKIRITEKNNIIYRLNINRIRREISNLFTEAKKIKHDYDTLLKGPVSEIVSITEERALNGLENTGNNETDLENDPIDDNTVNLIDLEKRSFLNSIDTLFQQYEEKIEGLNDEKKEYMLRLQILKDKSSEIKKKRKLFYAIQKTYSDEIAGLNMQIKKERDALEKTEGILREILIRVEFSFRLDEKSRPLLTLTPYRNP